MRPKGWSSMGQRQQTTCASSVLEVPGLQLLRDAWEYARDVAIDPWQFAVELQTLRAAGVSNNVLRWLIGRKFVQHGSETTRTADRRRKFRKHSSLSISDRDCFVLTETGYKSLRRSPTPGIHVAEPESEDSLSPLSLIAERPWESDRAGHKDAGAPLPSWDPRLRELRIGRKIVKRFKHPASAQESILSAFQEEGWPAAIDDPLPGQPGADPKRRLHYTVRNLNRAQSPQAIRFYINGNGELVRWEFVGHWRVTSARTTRLRR